MSQVFELFHEQACIQRKKPNFFWRDLTKNETQNEIQNEERILLVPNDNVDVLSVINVEYE